MAKKINFNIKSENFELNIEKLDRKKVYGWIEKVVLDKNDNLCKTVYFSSEENMLIASKGIARDSFNEEGNIIDKSKIVRLNEDDEEVVIKESSFKSSIALESIVSVECMLEHNIEAVYFMGNDEKFVEILKSIDGFFTFEFNYRDSYEGKPAFIVENDNNIFMLIGQKIDFEYISLGNQVILDEENEEEEDDDMDFGMF